MLDNFTWRAELDDLAAIDSYMRGLRVKIPEYPTLEPIIDAWEGWYSSLTVFEKSPLGIVDTLGEAKRRRKAANDAMGERLPPSWVPADGGQQPPEERQDALQAGIGTGIKIAIGVGVGLILLKLLG